MVQLELILLYINKIRLELLSANEKSKRSNNKNSFTNNQFKATNIVTRGEQNLESEYGVYSRVGVRFLLGYWS